MLKQTIISAMLMGIVCIAFASSGGGKKKASNNLGLIPITPKGTFHPGDRPAYSGSYLIGATSTKNATVYRSVVSYQKGNTTYLVPSRLRLTNGTGKVGFNSGSLSLKTNLNVVDLKIRLSR